jgi:hypothetical protein
MHIEPELREYARHVWAEYDDAALWCAKRGYTGRVGDPLPSMLNDTVYAIIASDPEAFQERVRASAYMIAALKHTQTED